EAGIERQTTAVEGALERSVNPRLDALQAGVDQVDERGVEIRDIAEDIQSDVKILRERDVLPLTLARDLKLTSFKMGDNYAATYPYIRTRVSAVFSQTTATLKAAAGEIEAKQGILMLGEANAGKTRLALEALREALPDWEVLVWSEAYSEDRIPSKGRLAG